MKHYSTLASAEFQPSFRDEATLLVGLAGCTAMGEEEADLIHICDVVESYNSRASSYDDVHNASPGTRNPTIKFVSNERALVQGEQPL